VDVRRNAETGDIEGVDKLSKADSKFLKDLTPHQKTKDKKQKSKAVEKRKMRFDKLKEKKQAKKEKHIVDEFAFYRDEVKFGEVVHEPPKLTTLPRKAEAGDRVMLHILLFCAYLLISM
jgi:hypothetical protein